MRLGKIEIKRRVLFGLGFMVVATGAWWVWTRSHVPAIVAVAQPRQPFVRLTGSGRGVEDEVLRERAEYFDPTPLFFPTERNFGQQELPASMRRQPGQVFGSFEAKLTFQDQGIKAYGVEAPALPEQFVEVLAPGNEVPFAGMGQIDVPRPVLAERSGFLEIRNMNDGVVIANQALIGVSAPQLDFRPIEFIAAISAGGLVSDPILVTSSGRDEVDTFMRTYLVKTFRLGERLSPGLYRILVGP